MIPLTSSLIAPPSLIAPLMVVRLLMADDGRYRLMAADGSPRSHSQELVDAKRLAKLEEADAKRKGKDDEKEAKKRAKFEEEKEREEARKRKKLEQVRLMTS